jgi:hypothetical protein
MNENKNEAVGTGEGTSARTGQMTGVLAAEGAPWRPFNEKGAVIKPYKTAQLPAALMAACERVLLTHLKAVCRWPESQRNESWRAGDYSFYVLSFVPAPGTQVYVQFWSEPDEDGVIFEVSSGAWNPPADQYVNADRQELLRDHGFEIGGNAENFKKTVVIANSKDLRGLAREAVAILTKVLDWNGTQALGYELSLQSGSEMRYVLEAVSPATLVKLMHEWGLPAVLKRSGDQPPLIESQTDQGSFGVLFGDETAEGSGSFRALKLRTYRKIESEDASAAASALNEALFEVKTTVDSDGDLMLESVIFLHHGVTAKHLQARFAIWRGLIGRIDEEV